MGKHCRWCETYRTDCLCNTCRLDDLIQEGASACCSYNRARTVDADENCSGVYECPRYLPENTPELEEKNHEPS
jgi:hypothetical protein